MGSRSSEAGRWDPSVVGAAGVGDHVASLHVEPTNTVVAWMWRDVSGGVDRDALLEAHKAELLPAAGRVFASLITYYWLPAELLVSSDAIESKRRALLVM